ncbi:ATP-binding cassette domain-containing protein [bacterium]|nr:ATP-binding cassette domain-containing protein [bacterium]
MGEIKNNSKYAINIENATVCLNQKEILHNINWKVKRGERYFILGANGAGKTTLVRTILGYVWALCGAKVEILGKTLGKVDLNELRKKIAWVSPFIQKHLKKSDIGVDTVLSGFEGSLGFGRQATKEELEKVKTLLISLDAIHLANKSICEMSSGEQMKILIARALSFKPELMIFDEPNVFLDIKEREFFLKTLDKILKNHPEITVIFISQRVEDILPDFDRGMILQNGKIMFSGTKEEVLTEENLKKVFGIDIKLIKTENGRLWSVIE